MQKVCIAEWIAEELKILYDCKPNASSSSSWSLQGIFHAWISLTLSSRSTDRSSSSRRRGCSETWLQVCSIAVSWEHTLFESISSFFAMNLELGSFFKCIEEGLKLEDWAHVALMSYFLVLDEWQRQNFTKNVVSKNFLEMVRVTYIL